MMYLEPESRELTAEEKYSLMDHLWETYIKEDLLAETSSKLPEEAASKNAFITEVWVKLVMEDMAGIHSDEESKPIDKILLTPEENTTNLKSKWVKYLTKELETASDKLYTQAICTQQMCKEITR